MTLLLKFQLYLWAVIFFQASQMLLMTWLFWPRLRHLWQQLHRKTHCIWCWQTLHIRQFYPERWSSSMCLHHRRAAYKRLAALRAARLALHVQPTITAIEAVSAHISEQQEVLA